MNKVLQYSISLSNITLFRYLRSYSQSEKIVARIPEIELLNSRFVKKVLKKPVSGRTRISQQGLWHGRQPQSGNQTCFSEKKSRRSWLPNSFKYTFHSSVLGRDIITSTTAKALRCIRKVNGFDNYILMTPAKQLDSLYGEYLRRIMLKTLNDPDFKARKILKTSPFKIKWNHKKIQLKGTPDMWHPAEIRHKDLSHMKAKFENQLNPKELRLISALEKLYQEQQDIPPTHPLLLQIEQQTKMSVPDIKIDLEAFEAEAKQVEEQFDAQTKLQEQQLALNKYYVRPRDLVKEQIEKTKMENKKKMREEKYKSKNKSAIQARKKQQTLKKERRQKEQPNEIAKQ